MTPLFVGRDSEFEIKFRAKIGFTVIADVKQKVARLGADPSLSVRTGLIYQGKLDPKIEPADYFDQIVPFETLLS